MTHGGTPRAGVDSCPGPQPPADEPSEARLSLRRPGATAQIQPHEFSSRTGCTRTEFSGGTGVELAFEVRSKEAAQFVVLHHAVVLCVEQGRHIRLVALRQGPEGRLLSWREQDCVFTLRSQCQLEGMPSAHCSDESGSELPVDGSDPFHPRGQIDGPGSVPSICRDGLGQDGFGDAPATVGGPGGYTPGRGFSVRAMISCMRLFRCTHRLRMRRQCRRSHRPTEIPAWIGSPPGSRLWRTTALRVSLPRETDGLRVGPGSACGHQSVCTRVWIGLGPWRGIKAAVHSPRVKRTRRGESQFGRSCVSRVRGRRVPHPVNRPSRG